MRLGAGINYQHRLSINQTVPTYKSLGYNELQAGSDLEENGCQILNGLWKKKGCNFTA